MPDTQLATLPPPPDAQTLSRVVDSIVVRGDLSALAPRDRALFYVQVCNGLGLNPAAKPFDFLKLNGKEVLYANKNAGDQLAAIHRVNRKIVDGPKVIDLAGTKLVFAVCEASLPNGRIETATATVPLADHANVLMKCETKAKRRATMSILGLSLLDEMELETIPANAQEPGARVDLTLLDAEPERRDAKPANAPVDDGEVDEVEREESAPASRAFAAFLDKLSAARELVMIFDLYAALLAGLRDEGHDPAEFTSGDDGAAAQARQRVIALGHKLAKAECQQVLMSRALAALLDQQTGVAPGPNGLALAADWWITHRESVKSTIDQAHRQTPWYALVRRYSGAQSGPDTQRAGKALEAAIKLREKTPPDGGGGGSTGGGGGSSDAHGGGGAGAPPSGGAPSARVVDEFRAHIAGLPERGVDRGAGRVAGGYWKRREDFLEEGTHAEAMGVVVDELARRGVEEPGSWLQQIGEQNGYVQRPGRAA